MKRFILLLCLFLAPVLAQAQCAGVTSCSSNGDRASVAAALASINVDGTNYTINAGTFTGWTSQIAITLNYSVAIIGGGNTIGSNSLGNPTSYNDVSVIQDGSGNSSTSFGRMLHITTTAGHSLRITGLTIQTGSGESTTADNGVIGIDGASHDVRIDHNHFNWAIGPKGVIVGGNVQGVADHNYVVTTTNVNTFQILGNGWKGLSESAGGDQSWADLSYFGSSQFFFLENNTFSGQHAFDCLQGGRLVFRYNTGTNAHLQTHGTGYDTRDRGCRAIEVYGNNVTGGGFSFWMQLESGSSMWWGNTVSGYNNFVEVDTVRTNNATYTQTAPPNGWGYCGNSVNGSTSVWDQNLSSDGHACMDGVGRGKGHLLSGGSGGSFTGTVDSITGTQTYPSQASDPVYSWGESISGLTGSYFSSLDGTSTASDRDYYLELPRFGNAATFNGTSGVGCGPAIGAGCANPVPRPVTCTSGVGYWNPATNTLYVCTSGNVWLKYYSPYTYPHPLAVPTPVNTLLNLDVNTPSSAGTQLTSTILNNGTVVGSPWSSSSGTLSAMTVGAHQSGCSMPAVVSVGSVEIDASVPTQSFAYNNTSNFSWWVQNVSGSPTKMSVGFCISPGLPSQTSSGSPADLVWLNTNLGKYSIIQECTNVNGSTCGSGTSGTLGFRIETYPANYSNFITGISQNVPVWCSLTADLSSGGTTTLECFSTSPPYKLIGTSSEAMPFNAGDFFNQVRLGNLETLTGTGTTYYENLMVDSTNAVFPLGVSPQSATYPGWRFVQESINTNNCSNNTACTINLANGNSLPTTAGTVWVMSTSVTNNVSVSSITGGGGTWQDCAACDLYVAGLSRNSMIWYNLSGTTGTNSFTVNLSGNSGAHFGLTFYEIQPPPGFLAAYDTGASASSTSCTTSCTGATTTLTATDAILQVMTANGPNAWNSYSAPYLSLPEGDGLALNVTSGAAPTITGTQGTGAIFNAIAFKSVAGYFPPTPQPMSVANYSFVTATKSCTPGCSLTIPSTGAGNLLYLQAANIGGKYITGVTGGGTWLTPAGCDTVVPNQTSWATSCAYALSSTAGVTTLNITMGTGSSTNAFAEWEINTMDNPFTLDAIGSHQNNTNSTGPSGVTLSLTGTNDVIFQSAFIGGGTSSVTLYPQPRIAGCGVQFYCAQAGNAALLNTINGTAPLWANEQNTQTAVTGAAFTSSSGSSNPAAATPSCSPGTGTYSSSQSVTCSDASSGAIMCYTLDGSTPITNGTTNCTNGTLYSGAIAITTSETLNVVAGGTGYTDSSEATYVYTISPPPPVSSIGFWFT